MIRSTSRRPAGVDRRERDAARLEPVAEIGLGHGEAGAEQGDPAAAVGDEPVGGGIGDVEHRQAVAAATASSTLCDGVGRQQQALGAATP